MEMESAREEYKIESGRKSHERCENSSKLQRIINKSRNYTAKYIKANEGWTQMSTRIGSEVMKEIYIEKKKRKWKME